QRDLVARTLVLLIVLRRQRDLLEEAAERRRGRAARVVLREVDDFLDRHNPRLLRDRVRITARELLVLTDRGDQLPQRDDQARRRGLRGKVRQHPPEQAAGVRGLRRDALGIG